MNSTTQIDINRTEPIRCKCGNEVFEAVNFLRSVSAFLSPTGRREIIPLPAFRCIKCKRMAELSEPEPPNLQKLN